MTIDPINRGQIQPSQAGKTDDAKADEQAQAKKAPAQTPEATTDKVEFSSTAQQLNEIVGAEKIEANTLPPERLKEIAKRVEEGFYDRPEIVEETARRVADDV